MSDGVSEGCLAERFQFVHPISDEKGLTEVDLAALQQLWHLTHARRDFRWPARARDVKHGRWHKRDGITADIRGLRSPVPQHILPLGARALQRLKHSVRLVVYSGTSLRWNLNPDLGVEVRAVASHSGEHSGWRGSGAGFGRLGLGLFRLLVLFDFLEFVECFLDLVRSSAHEHDLMPTREEEDRERDDTVLAFIFFSRAYLRWWASTSRHGEV